VIEKYRARITLHQIYKDVLKSFVYMSLIIELSKNKTVSGYDIMVHLKNFGLKASPGTIYYQIERLRKAKVIELINNDGGRGKKTYRITEEGLEAFSEFKGTWKQPIGYLCQNIRS